MPARAAARRARRPLHSSSRARAARAIAGTSTGTQAATKNALFVDQPIAGLLRDLKRAACSTARRRVGRRVGRTPFAQGKDGRDHNPFGFTIWLAGGGVKGGVTLRRDGRLRLQGRGKQTHHPRPARDDAAPAPLTTRGSRFRFSGRDFRLTDVEGEG